MKPRKAIHFAIVKDAATGRVLRIFNPTFEFEIALHNVSQGETITILKKSDFGISRASNAMTVDDVSRLVAEFSA